MPAAGFLCAECMFWEYLLPGFLFIDACALSVCYGNIRCGLPFYRCICVGSILWEHPLRDFLFIDACALSVCYNIRCGLPFLTVPVHRVARDYGTIAGIFKFAAVRVRAGPPELIQEEIRHGENETAQ